MGRPEERPRYFMSSEIYASAPPAISIKPAILQQMGDQAWATVEHLFGEPLKSPPADHDGVVAVRLSPPGERRAADQWYEMTPKIAVDVLISAVRWMCRGDLVKLEPEHFGSDYGPTVFTSAVWFLDHYWPAIRDGINRVINSRPWPPKLNPAMRLLAQVAGDSQYASLGVRTIDAISEAVLGRVRSPLLKIEITDRCPYPEERLC
jgi:hypothetical protein